MDFETAAKLDESEALNLCITAMLESKLMRADLFFGPNDRVPFYVGGNIGPNREILFDSRPDFLRPLALRPQTFDLPTPGHESHYSSRTGLVVELGPSSVRFHISVTPWVFFDRDPQVTDIMGFVDKAFTDFLNAGNNRAAAVSWRESHFPPRRINR